MNDERQTGGSGGGDLGTMRQRMHEDARKCTVEKNRLNYERIQDSGQRVDFACGVEIVLREAAGRMGAEVDRELVVANFHVRVMIELIRDVRDGVHEAHRLVEVFEGEGFFDLVTVARPALEL